MTSFTYTPSAKRAIGFATKNAEAKAAHDAAQLQKPEAERTAYTITDEQYAHAALDRVGDSYYAQILEAAGEAKWGFVLDVAETRSNPDVAAKLAELEVAVAVAKG